MKLIEFIKLLLKHKVILFVVPLFTAVLAVILTRNGDRNYYSQTMLYTGLASGSSIEMDKSFNYFAINIGFDNLINIINSRETQEEVAIRLLAQHLYFKEPNTKYISGEAFVALQKVLPDSLYEYVVRSNEIPRIIMNAKGVVNTIPEQISKEDYEQTVQNLMTLMNSDNYNFLYALLNFDQPYYSLEAIKEIKAQRISNSDLLKLSYTTDDPGICQQTLAIFNEVCIRKYKFLKENGSDAVVRYFEAQLAKSEVKLKSREQKLLKFNQDYNIINFFEQSKAVAIVKEDMEVEYNRKKAELAGSKASARKLEQKLDIQELVQAKSSTILNSKKKLGELSYKYTMVEARSSGTEEEIKELDKLRGQIDVLEDEIKVNVEELYKYHNSVEGVPLDEMIPEWVDKVVETENIKAKLDVMGKRNIEFQEQYALYAPAGANLKRLEREIGVAEQEYLDILHGLNLAKLKFQDTQLSSNLKAVDPPYFPLKSVPSKRKIIILALGIVSFIFLLAAILFMEFFDSTLKNIERAKEILNLTVFGMMPKLFMGSGELDLKKAESRLMEFMMQNLYQFLKSPEKQTETKLITLISTRQNEGKTVIANNMARKLKESGSSVVVLNYTTDKKKLKIQSKISWLHKLLGYQDPRNDYSLPFFEDVDTYLSDSEQQSYKIDSSFKDAVTHVDLLKDVELEKKPDYVIVELPSLLELTYPSDLISKSDLVLLVCRSNRLWSKADDTLLDKIKKLAAEKIQFIINGVEIKEVEVMLGELPRKRSEARKNIKNILKLQFFSKSQI